MEYSWTKNFYEEGDKPFDFKTFVKWNGFVFKLNYRMKIRRIYRKIIYNPLYQINCKFKPMRRFFKLKYKQILMFITVKIILYKLKKRKKEIIDIEKSPYSESIYINYRYDSPVKNYIQIRISTHGNLNSNADVLFLFKCCR